LAREARWISAVVVDLLRFEFPPMQFQRVQHQNATPHYVEISKWPESTQQGNANT
jgi:hypothetical protein